VYASPGVGVSGATAVHSGVMGAASGGTLEVEGTKFTGTGSWIADGGVIDVMGDVETTGDVSALHGGSLKVDTTMSARNLLVDDTSSLDIEGVLRVAQNVDFDGPNAGRWHFGSSASLQTNGPGGASVGAWGAWQSFEAAGRDLGLVAAGFANDNFYLPELVVGSDGRLVLRDRRDNGNRASGGHEAVYVDTLVFSDSLGLLDLNGIDLYYNHLVGSPDQIIDVAVPEPSLAWLVACALVGLLVGHAKSSKASRGESSQ